jgi:hypothetical protein
VSARKTSAAAPPPTASVEGDPAGREPELLNRWWLRGPLLVLAGMVFVAVVVLAAAHADDRYGLDHVSGARMALGQYFNHGTLYPELFDGEFYGGTRWMPLPTILHGLAARITGEYLVSGKLISYASMALLLLVMLWVMRRLGTPSPLALGLTAMVLVTKTGLAASMDLRFDSLPLVLQLLAVETVVRKPRTPGVVGAAALASLALISKTSALWAPIAIVVWLFFRHRRRAAWFSVAYLGFAGASLLAFTAITDGRIIENVFGLSASGIAGVRSLIVAPYRFVDLMVTHATPAWALLPLAAYGGWLAVKKGWFSIHLIALLCAAVVLVLVLSDIGTGWNQLLDVIVLAAIVVGELAGRAVATSGSADQGSRPAVGAILALTVLWLDASGAATVLLPAIRETISAPETYRRDPLEGYASSGTSILSEDPYVPVSLGQVPVVLDPFMLLRIGQEHPGALDPLIQRIEDREFDLVALVVPLRPVEQRWWSEYHFGVDVMRALAASYVPRGKVQGYYLYTPSGPAAL